MPELRAFYTQPTVPLIDWMASRWGSHEFPARSPKRCPDKGFAVFSHCRGPQPTGRGTGRKVYHRCTTGPEGALPRVKKLTATLIAEAVPPTSGSYYLMDDSLPGFGIRVYPGSKVYCVRFRRQTHQLHPVELISQKKVRIEAAELLLRLRRGEGVARAEPWTIVQLFARMDADHYSVRQQAGTARRNRAQWRNNILPHLGAVRVAEVRRDQVRELMLSLSAVPQSANRCLALLVHAFNQAEIWEPAWRPPGTNPCRGIEPYPHFPRQRVLSEEEFVRLGAALQQAEDDELANPVACAVIRFMLFTGCRPGEARHARWDQVELLEQPGEDGSVRWLGRLVLPRAKGDRGGRTRGRTIWLSAEAVEVLRSQAPIEGNPHIFPGSLPGRELRWLRNAWVRIRDLAGLPPEVVPYSLRHSYVTEGDAADVDLGVMRDLAGHARIATTDAVYRHGRESAQVEAAQRMGAHLRGLIGGKKD